MQVGSPPFFHLLHQKLIKGLLYLVAYILRKFFVWIDIDDILFGTLVGIQFKVTENAPPFEGLTICRLDLDHTAVKLVVTHSTRFFSYKYTDNCRFIAV